MQIGIYRKKYMLIAEQFIQNLIRKYGNHRISTDGCGTWYHSLSLQIPKDKIKHIIFIPHIGRKALLSKEQFNT